MAGSTARGEHSQREGLPAAFNPLIRQRPLSSPSSTPGCGDQLQSPQQHTLTGPTWVQTQTPTGASWAVSEMPRKINRE